MDPMLFEQLLCIFKTQAALAKCMDKTQQRIAYYRAHNDGVINIPYNLILKIYCEINGQIPLDALAPQHRYLNRIFIRGLESKPEIVTQIDVDLLLPRLPQKSANPEVLKALCESIESKGLQHPIGLNLSGYLVFGHLRCLAFHALRRKKIPCYFIDIEGWLAARAAPHSIVSCLPISDLISIGLVLEDQFHRYQGQPNKSNKVFIYTPCLSKKRDHIAKILALGSGHKYYTAKVVMQSDRSDLISAMDRGEIKIGTAYRYLKKGIQL